VYAWWRAEPVGTPTFLGLYRTSGPVAYAAWVLAAVGWVALRRTTARTLIGAAIVITLLTTLSTTLGPERPPLWIVMSLTAFGFLAFLGTRRTGPATVDERWNVPTGALAVAVVASTVMTLWPPAGRFAAYYQPTVARVGAIAGVVVVLTATVALARLVRGRGGLEWLWATVLLALPAGWLGPFEAAALGRPDEPPRFGRLAQVLLASSLAAAAIAVLAQRRPPGATPVRTTNDRDLATAASAAVGFGAGLAVLAGVWAGLNLGPDGWGFAGTDRAAPLPLLVTLAALATCGALGLALRSPRRLGSLVAGAAVALVLGPAVAIYDNVWTFGGWPDYPRTLSLVAMLAFLPLFGCGLLAARRLATGFSWPAAATVAVCVAWVAYVTVPYVRSWAPALLGTIVCCVAVALFGRRSPLAR